MNEEEKEIEQETQDEGRIKLRGQLQNRLLISDNWNELIDCWNQSFIFRLTMAIERSKMIRHRNFTFKSGRNNFFYVNITSKSISRKMFKVKPNRHQFLKC
uniref:Uncharacterized protein n=1 Tax=Clastoptera arizonana TaxID=38151 RepID=A0A1B6CDD2_9HEMI